MKTLLVVTMMGLASCVVDEATEDGTSVESSELSTPEVGYYCSTVWPTNGWTFVFGSGDTPCSGSAAGSVRSTGLYAANGWNTVEARCAPSYSWIYVGWGSQPLSWAYDAAATTPTGGRCEFVVTMSSKQARQDPANTIPGCASGAAAQDLGVTIDATGARHQLVGCAGSVTWTNRASLCATDWKPASAATWAAAWPAVSPTHNYWTDDNLRYSGTATSCSVSRTVGTLCPSSSPMRLCTATGGDAEGNTCTWRACTLAGTTRASFGGCTANPTAGTVCELVTPAPTPVTPMAPHYFDVGVYTQQLIEQINQLGNVGYQLSLYDANGNAAANVVGGWATRSPTPVAMPIDRRWNISSTSKLITATAFVAAIEDLQRRGIAISLDSSIRGYVPSHWYMPASARNVTFRQLLVHRSGYTSCWGDDYNSIAAMVSHGPNAELGRYSYSNCNYALMRILIAYVVDGPQAYRPYEGNDEVLARLTAASYRAYVRGRIFAPLGLASVDERFTGPGVNQYFEPGSWISCGSSSTENGDSNILLGGAGYWTISANEYARFLSNLTRGRIVSPAGFAAMRAAAADIYTLGMMRWTGSYGLYYEHGGGAPCRPATQFAIFPNGYVTMFVTNTNKGLGFKPLFDAFDAAVR